MAANVLPAGAACATLVALRATNGPKLARSSAKVGDELVVTAKVENTAGADADVALAAEGTPVPIVFEPAAKRVPAKSRASVSFSWRATLPDGVDAKTLRGKLLLRDAASGALVGSAPLDVYVTR